MTAIVLTLIGLALAFGGVRLIALGGSWYYAPAGAAIAVSGFLLWQGRALGAWLYGLMLGATLVWSLWEVGVDLWALAPRLLAPVLVGLWLTTPWVARKLDFPASTQTPTQRVARAHISTAAAAIGFMVLALILVRSMHEQVAPAVAAPQAAATDWPQIGAGLGGERFVAPTQINPDNVSALHQAWVFHTGEHDPTFETTPILASGLLIFCTARDVIIALDPETGEQRWRYDPHADIGGSTRSCRGVGHDSVAHATGVCAERVFVGTINAKLIALDAATGAPCARFGQNGVVSLLQGIGDFSPRLYHLTSPPLAVNGLVIVGSFVADNEGAPAPSGVVRAFDANTGALRWAWDMGRPQRHGAPPDGQTYTLNTPNAWSVLSADPELGLVYLPMGNPGTDFWGATRREFDERYGSGVVALDLRTGAPRWNFQATHHDLWDYDAPAQPVLADLPGAPNPRHALILATKTGDIFVLDRATGAPLFPVEERPAPQGGAEGDRVSPTQPHSAVSLAPPRLRERDMWGMTPFDQLACRIQFRQLRYDGAYTPPGVRATLRYPGGLGVIDWGGVSVDAGRGLLVANTSSVAYVDELKPQVRRALDQAPFTVRTQPFLGSFQIPCTAPPWGKLNAIDLTTGRLAWSHPIGTAYDSGPLFLRSHLAVAMGVPNLGGAITTRSGLIFVAATVDHYLRAFDTRTGKELWRGRLPAAGHATPMTYVAPNGRQYVVIAAGGHARLGPVLGDFVVAYSLPGNLITTR